MSAKTKYNPKSSEGQKAKVRGIDKKTLKKGKPSGEVFHKNVGWVQAWHRGINSTFRTKKPKVGGGT